MAKIRTYSELRKLTTFDDRFLYLQLGGEVSAETFGVDRYLNQEFYKSVEWRRARDYVIARDSGCDLGIFGHEIYDKVYVHHMNPMVVDDLINFNEDILDPEFLITVSHDTHNAIHYGNIDTLRYRFAERTPGDTTPWLQHKETSQ